jgi:hypothetical protein
MLDADYKASKKLRKRKISSPRYEPSTVSINAKIIPLWQVSRLKRHVPCMCQCIKFDPTQQNVNQLLYQVVLVRSSGHQTVRYFVCT